MHVSHGTGPEKVGCRFLRCLWSDVIAMTTGEEAAKQQEKKKQAVFPSRVQPPPLGTQALFSVPTDFFFNLWP